MKMDLGLESLQNEECVSADHDNIMLLSIICLQHELQEQQLSTINKLLEIGVGKEVIQQLITDDISNVDETVLRDNVIKLSTKLNDEFIQLVSSEGLWTTLKYTFTSDTKVQKLIDEASKKISKFSDSEWNSFLNKKVSTTCFNKQSAMDMTDALSSIVSGLVKYFNLIEQYGWIFQPDDVQRVKTYDPMQYQAILARLKPIVAAGDEIYAKLTKGNKYDGALTGRYQTVKASSLSNLGFDKNSVLKMLKQHAQGSAGCKNIVKDLMNLCANYGTDANVETSHKIETSVDDEGKTDTSYKRVTEVKAVAKQSFAQITKLAQLAVTIYTPLDKFIYAISKNV